ncbi:MAG: HD domain-containing protein [Deltaproteobacteria bacterium]|nr:HD domain-containing protein [Deltaproteobacteria bacterium]
MNDIPLYSTRIIQTFIEHIKGDYPKVDIDVLLDHSDIKKYQLDDDGHWFNQKQVDRFHDAAVEATGNHKIAFEAGRSAPSSKAAGPVQQYVLGFINTSTAYTVMSKLYPQVSRACTLKTKRLSPNEVEIVVTPKQDVKEKPYQCENRKGMFEGIAKLFTGKYAEINHPKCIHDGQDTCQYIIKWDLPTSRVWKRIRNWIVSLNVLLCLVQLFTPEGIYWGATPIVICSILMVMLSFYPDHLERNEKQVELKNNGEVASDLLDRINTSYNNTLLVQKIGQATASIMAIEELLPIIMELLEKHLEFDRGMIMLANREKTLLEYNVGYGYKPEIENLLKSVSFHLDKSTSKGSFVVSFKKQIPFLVDNISKAEGNMSKKSIEFARALGVKSFICVPIIYEGKSEGILAVDNLRSKRALSQSDLNLLLGIAPQIGISINNARAYKKVIESEKKFRSLGENSPDIIYTLDANGVVDYLNPAFEKRFQYKTDEVIGKDFTRFTKKEEFDFVSNIFNRASKLKETIRDVTITLVDKDNTGHLFNVSGAPNFDQEDNLTRMVGVLKDISDLKRNFDTLQLTLQSMINAMSEIVESRDPYTAGHQKRVSEIACAIAEEMDLSFEMVNGIRMASMIHDIGKMYIPAEILSKPGVLSDLEFSMMKSHPEVGYNILKKIEFNHPIAEAVYQHHERIDGSGYPRGLSGDEILLEAKIIAVADVVEAMGSHRPYRPALGIGKALEEITNRKGIVYDPDIVDACLKLFKEEKIKVA